MWRNKTIKANIIAYPYFLNPFNPKYSKDGETMIMAEF